MSKARFLALFLTLALLVTMASAVMAQDDEATMWDPANVAEFNEDEALIPYGQLREALVEMGVPIEEQGAAIDFLDGEFLSQAGDDEATDDDEFGQAEEDEPELGDDEADSDD